MIFALFAKILETVDFLSYKKVCGKYSINVVDTQ